MITADRVRQTIKHPEIEEEDNKFTEQLGSNLASILRLRRDPEYRDRWQTSHGSKSNLGLARTIVAILEEASK